LGISNIRTHLVLTILLIIINSGCTKIGKMVGVDIPDDNIIDENINKSIWYPIRDQMCSWNFRISGCEDENTSSTTSSTENNQSICPVGQKYNEVTAKCEDEQTLCPDGLILENGKCISSNNGNGYKDIQSKWYDILTEEQQNLIQKDKNNISPDNKNLPILTLLDEVPNGAIKMLQNTKVVLPYYVLHEKVPNVLAITRSSDENVTYPRIIDSSSGSFKVIDTNSILFLELDARGKVGESASVSLKVQEEDANKYDLEELNVSIVDDNYTYNPVSLFFTYNTIIIEEGDSRNIYFGISYTIDSDVKVLVRSEIEKILSQLDNNTTLDLTSYGEDNSILSANIVPNKNGVPFYFKLDAKGKAGDSMELFLVAIDNKGNYDYKKFNVLIVGKGKGDYKDVVIKDSNNSNYTPLQGNDFDKLTDAQKVLVNNDNNNYEPTSITRPVITVFNNPLKIHKGESVITTFYVADRDNDEIYTAVYDDIAKVKANIDNLGKFGVTYSNKLFFLQLDAVGEVGDVVPITIYSQNRNDASLFDQETFNVEIVADNADATYIPPLIYLGFDKIFIEEGGFRDGLQFSVTKSRTISIDAKIRDENIVKFQWITKDSPKFSLKALGKAGDKTTLTLSVSDGENSDSRDVEIEIIPVGTLKDYIAKEKENTSNNQNQNNNTDNNQNQDNNTDNNQNQNNNADNNQNQDNNTDNNQNQNNNTDNNKDQNTNTDTNSSGSQPISPTCETGYHIENGSCVIDDKPLICESGYYLENNQCVPDGGGEPVPPTCETGYHIENGSCVIDDKPLICESGYYLENNQCVPDGGGEPIPPMCEDGYHLENNRCVIDSKPLTCESGYHIENNQCVPDNTNPVTPICGDGQHLDEATNSCVDDVTECPDGQHIENGVCVDDRNLDQIPYDQWTEEEKAQKSLEICYIKMDDPTYTTLKATAVRAEGFSNKLGTIIIHTNKVPIVNGVAQNVTLTMIYKEIYSAKPDNKMLDAVYTVPKFRIDYTVDYAGGTFYIIDEGNGKCYVNTFPDENTLPFGILDMVTPDGVQSNF